MITFKRVQDNIIVGSISADKSGALVATGTAVSLLENARARGESDSAVLKKYSSWSNGFFYSEDSAASRRARAKEK